MTLKRQPVFASAQGKPEHKALATTAATAAMMETMSDAVAMAESSRNSMPS
jgi:hypothetical protein